MTHSSTSGRRSTAWRALSGIAQPRPIFSPGRDPRRLQLTAIGGDAPIGPIAAQLGHHDAAVVDVRCAGDGTAHLALGPRDPEPKVALVAERLRRLVSGPSVTPSRRIRETSWMSYYRISRTSN